MKRMSNPDKGLKMSTKRVSNAEKSLKCGHVKESYPPRPGSYPESGPNTLNFLNNHLYGPWFQVDNSAARVKNESSILFACLLLLFLHFNHL